jgi:hypothetical protein
VSADINPFVSSKNVVTFRGNQTTQMPAIAQYRDD